MIRFVVSAVTLALVVGGAAPVAEAGSPTGSGAVRPVDGAVMQVFEPPPVPWDRGNRGLKLAARPGEEIRAALAGTVVFAGEVADTGWVTVDHGGGLHTTYGVVEPQVPVGRQVQAGEVVARLAEEADHLHWGARRDGEYVDPSALLERWRPRLVAPPGGDRPP